MKKRAAVLILIIVIVAGGVYWTGRSKEPTSGKIADTEYDKSVKELEQKILSFNIDGRTSKGVKQWHLEGESAEMIEDQIHFNDLKAIAYGEDTTINLTSDRGIYIKDKGEVILMGNVRVVSGDGSVLTADSAKWSQNTKEISSDDFIRIERDNMVAVGKGGVANSSEKKAMLKKDVEVAIEPDTQVNSDGSLVVDHNNNVAIFHDNVRVKDKDGRLLSDKLTVNFDPESQRIAEVVAEGNVKMRRGKSYTISDKVIYTETTKSAKLIGNPRIIIDPEELQQLEGMKIGE